MNESTLNKMRQMKFWGMSRAFQTNLESGQFQKMTPDEMISFLIESEWDDRHNRNIDRHIKNAKFRYFASIENLKYNEVRNLDKNQMMRFGDCTFIKNHENILITGSTGVGKSFIATALGYQACSLGFKVLYASTSKLLSKLKISKADGSYMKEIYKIEKLDLLILDDFGLHAFDNQQRSTLMEIIEDRHGKGSVIITSQIPVNLWYDVIGEQTMADAILDRIIHGAHRIELLGESLRKIKEISKMEFLN